MSEQKKITLEHNECLDIAKVIATVKERSRKPDIERVFMLGFLRGTEFKTESEAIASGQN